MCSNEKVGKFVSSSEDGTVRVWEGIVFFSYIVMHFYCLFSAGVCKQVIPFPATSVWSVAVSSDGDILAGSR